jgi:uncharacterized protein YbjT (DUF2867 family)
MDDTIHSRQESADAARASAGGSKVLVTGGSGFVGRYIIRELVAGGYVPSCLVRSPEKLLSVLAPEQQPTLQVVVGDVFDSYALEEGARGCSAAIHLIGIIDEQPGRGVTFERMHVDATRVVMEACSRAGIRRYVHMSALGTRPLAVSRYHRTKWTAEELVRGSGLDWTIFRPSLIHGPDGEFMQMMNFFCTHPFRVPVLPYFGNGRALVQPISVLDVAECFVKSLAMPETVGQTFDLAGPDRFTWRELYDLCAQAFVGHRRLKLGIPTPLAKLTAKTIVPRLPAWLMPYKYNVSQVQMSQEDSTSDTAGAVERIFGIRLRRLPTELTHYAGRIA